MTNGVEFVVLSGILSIITLIASLELHKYRKCIIVKNLLPSIVLGFNTVVVFIYLLIILVESVVVDDKVRIRIENEISNFIFLIFIPFNTYILLNYYSTVNVRSADIGIESQFTNRRKSYNFLGPYRLLQTKSYEFVKTKYKSKKRLSIFYKNENNILLLLCLNVMVYFISNSISTLLPEFKRNNDMLVKTFFSTNLAIYYFSSFYTLIFFYRHSFSCYLRLFFLPNFVSVFIPLTLLIDFKFVFLCLNFFLLINSVFPVIYLKYHFNKQIRSAKLNVTNVQLVTDKYLYYSLLEKSEYFLANNEIKLWKNIQLYRTAPVRKEAKIVKLRIYYKFLDINSRNSIIMSRKIRKLIHNKLGDKDIYRNVFDGLFTYVFKHVISYMFIDTDKNKAS